MTYQLALKTNISIMKFFIVKNKSLREYEFMLNTLIFSHWRDIE